MIDKNFLQIAKNYFENVSPESTAISINVLDAIYDNLISKPVKVIDFGSDLSSVFFRYTKKFYNQELDVTSVDDNLFWLDKTKSFLKDYELETSKLYLSDEKEKFNDHKYDVVLFDFSLTVNRVNYIIDYIEKFNQDDNLFIIDDCHKQRLRDRVLNAGYSLERFGETDSYGRYTCVLKNEI